MGNYFKRFFPSFFQGNERELSQQVNQNNLDIDKATGSIIASVIGNIVGIPL